MVGDGSRRLVEINREFRLHGRSLSDERRAALLAEASRIKEDLGKELQEKGMKETHLPGGGLERR
jgi:hypothetical protein